ncbi:MAG: acyl-CoA dehydrogenase family protein [Burkholderiales bacterium]|nr:acyl-CoA dehydrogenase family protein [Burkholderiales bacterium]
MNFDDTPAEAAFRAEARAWIRDNALHELHDELAAAGFGQPALRSRDLMSAARAWQQRKHAAGWACLHWPREYGGRGAAPIERVLGLPADMRADRGIPFSAVPTGGGR